MIVQKLKKLFKENLSVAQRYYSVLSAVNDLKLTEREIQLIAFIAVYGSVSVADNRKLFCEHHKTTNATVNNMVSKLKKRGILNKEKSKIIVNSIICLDFSRDVQLEIKLIHE